MTARRLDFARVAGAAGRTAPAELRLPLKYCDRGGRTAS